MNKKLIEELINCGVKKTQIEKEIGMPKNSLSGMLSGSKGIPEKWVEPLTIFLLNLSAPKLESPKESVDDLENTFKAPEVSSMVLTKGGLKEPNLTPSNVAARGVADIVNKDFGVGTIMRLGDLPESGYEVISTGSLGLDIALGIGGLPKGRVVEIFGAESSGKTTIATHVIANAQKEGLVCLLVDAENSFDPEYAASIGVKCEDLFYCQPAYGEQGLEVADRFISDGKVGVVVIDSVAALIPKAELEGEMGDSKMGLHARLMSQAMRKMSSSISKNKVICIFINQIRNKIGVMYGSPETTTGGMALQFYASIRLRVSRSTQIKNGDEVLGNQTVVKVVKNKCAPPFRTVTFDIIYGKGINRIGEIVDLGVEFGVIKKSGSWYSFNDNKLGQGRDAVIQLLSDNEELMNEIEPLVLNN